MHTPEDDVYLGRYVLEHNLVSREALLECLFEIAQERRAGAKPGYAPPLGVLLVSRGLLTEEELNATLGATLSAPGSGRSLGEMGIGKLLAASGLVSNEQVQECLTLQQNLKREGRQPPRLGELVVQKGYCTEQQVMRVLAYQKQRLFVCSGCRVRVTSTAPAPGTRYRCKKCGGELTPLDRRSEAGAGGGIAMKEATRGEEVQLEVDRALGAYLKQKELVRRDQVRDCQRLQVEFARYGLIVPLAEVLRRTGAITVDQQRELEEIKFDQIVQNPEWKKEAVPGYRLQERIISSSWSTIYRAEGIFGSEKVAVKLLHPEHSKVDWRVERFESEAALLRKFSCPHIVKASDSGTDIVSHFVILEPLDGRSLGQAMSEMGAFPLRHALNVTRQVAEGLRFLHAEGHLHRDVKPDNVIIDKSGLAKICDLTFASKIEDAEEQQETRFGIADPAAEGGRRVVDLNVAADVYALGILLYALLTGHEPFEGVSGEEPVTEQIENALPVPNLMIVDAPTPVLRFIKRILHPDPTRRFATMGEVVTALDQLLSESR